MKQRTFISFNDYLLEKQALVESSKSNDELNEGVIDTIKNVIKKIKDFFTGKGAHFLNLLLLQQKHELPGKVKIIPSTADLEALSSLGSKIAASSIPKLKVNETHSFVEELSLTLLNEAIALNEAIVPLEYAKATDVDLATIKDKIDLSISTKKPILIWGAPGIGKTSLVNLVNNEYGGRLIDVPLSTMMPENFFLPAAKTTDFTNSNYADRVAIDLPIYWLPVYHISEGKEGDARVNGIDGKGGVLFLDELTRANKSVLNTCLKLILERKVGDYHLGSAWAVICAANRDFDDPNSEINVDLSALDNRVKHYNYVPDRESWADWAMGEVKAKAEGSDELEYIIDPSIPAFIRFTDKYFHYLDTDDYKHAWPSPRSWAEAGQEFVALKKRAKERGKTLTQADLKSSIAATVGAEAATEFMAFLGLMEKINLDDIKKAWTSPEKAPLPPLTSTKKDYKPDEAYAIISSIIYDKNKKVLTKKEIINIVDYLVRLGKEVPANGVKWITLAMKMLISSHPELNPKSGDKELSAVFSGADGMTKIVDAFPSYLVKE